MGKSHSVRFQARHPGPAHPQVPVGEDLGWEWETGIPAPAWPSP